MKYKDRERIADGLGYESRLAFVAFCIERCLKEAQRHETAREQLAALPHLAEGLELLWARAGGAGGADASRIEEIRKRIAGFERSAPDDANLQYAYDVTLVKAANELRGGLRLLEDPESLAADVVVSALEGPEQAVGLVYEDRERSQDEEIRVIDEALQRLGRHRSKPVTRELFADIPEWTRGKVSAKYAEGRVTGTDLDVDD